jgi:hypothetical protein
MTAEGSDTNNPSGFAPVRFYLVERERLFARIRAGDDLPALLAQMTAASALFGAAYGLTVGVYAGGWQPLYNAVKIPGMLLATLALCVLALYMLASLIGSRLGFAQTAALVLSAILVTTTLLAALTPPLGFLMLTSLDDYAFVVFINLLVIAACGTCGARFAVQAAAAMHRDQTRLRDRFVRLTKAWMGLYGLVGMQMLWLFRPYFRETDVFIRPLGESAFSHAGKLLLGLLQRLL